MKKMYLITLCLSFVLCSSSKAQTISAGTSNSIVSSKKVALVNIGSLAETATFVAGKSYNWAIKAGTEAETQGSMTRLKKFLSHESATVSNEVKDGVVITFDVVFTADHNVGELKTSLKSAGFTVSAKGSK